MLAFTLLSIFAFGAIIGSFLNVVVLRLGTGIGFFKSSFCFTCRAALRFYELVPIFSFLAQRGRCRTCRSKIHFQYPLVEALSGILFLLVWLREMGSTTLLDIFLFKNFSAEMLAHLLIWWSLASVLLAIAAYDIRHKIIPDSFVYVFIALAFFPLFVLWMLDFGFWEHGASHLAAGFIFFLLFAALWLFSRGRWMGFGDAKLAAGMGILFGFSGGTAALILSFWTGAVVSLALLSLARLKNLSRDGSRELFPSLKMLTMKSEIPFAPFLIFGTLAAYFFQIDFFDIAGIFIIG